MLGLNVGVAIDVVVVYASGFVWNVKSWIISEWFVYFFVAELYSIPTNRSFA